MAKIAKAYRSIFKDPDVFYASDTVRAFNDVYELVNGNLDSANFNQNMILGASRVNISAGFSSTTLFGAVDERRNLAYHTIHYLCNDNTISLYPGRMIIKNEICVLNTKLTFVESDFLPTNAAVFASGAYICIAIGASDNITASDVRILGFNDFTASLAFSDEFNGYYPAAFSGNRRVCFAFRNRPTGEIETWGGLFIDPPHEGITKILETSEAENLIFSASLGADITGGLTYSSITLFYNSTYQNYSYFVGGTLPSSTGSFSFPVDLFNWGVDNPTLDNFIIEDSGNISLPGFYPTIGFNVGMDSVNDLIILNVTGLRSLQYVAEFSILPVPFSAQRG